MSFLSRLRYAVIFTVIIVGVVGMVLSILRRDLFELFFSPFVIPGVFLISLYLAPWLEKIGLRR